MLIDEIVLEMRGISKSFPGVKALENVELVVRAGEVHALMGENGAGKSTLMKILNGVYQKDSGSILLNKKEFLARSPKEAINNGIAMIYQELNPVLDMMVYENIFLGRELKNKLGLVDKMKMINETGLLFEQIGIGISPTSKMKDLSVAKLQLVEIVKAISLQAKVIVMDEPTSAITETEAEILFEQIEKLKKNNVAIIYISHKMNEIFKISDRITILRDGMYIGTYASSEIDNERLISLMVNRKIEDIYPVRTTQKGEELLKVENLSYQDKLKQINFSLYSGEILGIAGLVGSGRSELVETVFGLHKRSSGVIKKANKVLNIKSPKDAIKAGISLITEDRKVTGLNLKGSVKDNISLIFLKRFVQWGVIHKNKELNTVSSFVKKLAIKAADMNTVVASLSGGNQQKIVISKWLLGNPDIIIFDEPTRGIDVGAKREIYSIMVELAKEGKGIIIISSEMPELIGTADRIIVMHEGKITGEIEKADFSQELIMKYASGIN